MHEHRSPLLLLVGVALTLGCAAAGDGVGTGPSGGKADGFVACAELEDAEERALIEAATEIADAYLTGRVDERERDRRVTGLLSAHDGDPRRLGVAKLWVSRVAEAMAAELVLPFMLDRDQAPDFGQRRVLAGLGVADEDLDAYLDAGAETFAPYRDALTARGAAVGAEGWSFEGAGLSPREIAGDATLSTALALFLSPAAAAALADPDRVEAVITERWVFLPPAAGRIEARPRHRYDDAVAQRLAWFAQDLDAFVRGSRESATYWNLMSGRLWQLFGYERGHGGRTAPEIERDAAYDSMVRGVRALRELGAASELISALHRVTAEALAIDRRNLDAGLARLDLAFRAALVAPALPVLLYLAPVAGAWLGPAVAAATAKATATLALVPFAFALAGAAIEASIDASFHGELGCHLVDALYQRGAAALWSAPFLAAIPSLVVSGAGLAGLATSSAAVATTAYGVLNVGVALGFVGHLSVSGLSQLDACRRRLAEAQRLAESVDAVAAVDAAAEEALHLCADGGLDLSFAIVGGRSLAAGAFRAIGRRGAAGTELALTDHADRPLPLDYYERLGIEHDAPPAEVRAAYRRRAAATHPDAGGSARELVSVVEAWELLRDPASRLLYDHALGARPLPAAEPGRPDPASVLGRPLDASTTAAVDVAHRIGLGEIGRDGIRDAAVGNYRPVHLFAKARVLRDAGLSWADIRALMEAGVVGRPARDLRALTPVEASHFELTTDLFHGRVVDARPFSADGNRNSVFLAEVHNPRTGRTRGALFKPRSWGDGDGWNRTPGEYVAYVLNRQLGMDYVPPVAYRRSFDVHFERYAEGALLHRVAEARPLREVARERWGEDADAFLSDARVLDVLLHNADRHAGNYLHGRHWVDGRPTPVLIDHGAALRPGTRVRLEDTGALGDGAVRVVRARTLERLRALTFERLKSLLGEFVSDAEIHGILDRRDGVVRYFEALIREHGGARVVIEGGPLARVLELRPRAAAPMPVALAA